ncbi:hypothetical protein PUR71_33240 [Streptomyces sp. SP17BM10]|uniref:hypothetical protein n=1 Tax=Streptomyces sp. SP17BM10 TaxID=3002530 RepID=UPI002E75C8E8|nr:hypothetical protein [Streptomyces sp. SP17BM10]MEE1787737.1 hypothetical protein [Streptomyces sp. SP17BM10]
MIVSVSLAVAAGITLFFLLRHGYLRLGSAMVAVLFGYALASTGLHTAIDHLIATVAGAAGSLH